MTDARNERNQFFEKNKNFVFHIYKFNLEKTDYKKWNEKQYLPRFLFILFLFQGNCNYGTPQTPKW